MKRLFSWLSNHKIVLSTAVYTTADVVLRLAALVVVPHNRRPSSAVAWLLAIMVWPIVAFPLFLLLGRAELPRKRREKQKMVNRVMRERSQAIPDREVDEGSPSWLQSAVSLNRDLGAFSLTGNNSADLEIDYQTSLDRMAADIRTARSEVHVLFYAMALDDVTRDFFDALAEAADRGVTVRVLYDHLGSLSHWKQYRAMRAHLDAHGIEHFSMMPVKPFRDGAFQRPDLRNHRKLLIVDGEIGWMGSQNVIAPHYGKRVNIRRGLRWQETMVRFLGPIVSEINLLFATDWFYEAGETLAMDTVVRPARDTSGSYEAQLLPSGPGFVSGNNLMLFNQLFYSASQRIVAVTPYFVPDESMLAALTTAARRGVEVELFVSEVGNSFITFHAQRSYYSALLAAGVRIHEYAAPGLLHAKHATIDESVAVIGSSNMDIRSFLLQMECSLMVGGEAFMDQMHQVEEVYRSRSRELSQEEWSGRPLWIQVVDNLCRLASSIV